MSGDHQALRSPALEQAARDYRNTGAPEALEKVVRCAEPLVAHFSRLYSPGRRDEDLKQAGYEGLLKAAKRFEPGRDALFATYASHCIIGEIRREIKRRRIFRVPEYISGLQAAVIKATDQLLQEKGATPTLKEIAERVNVAEAGIIEAMQAGAVSLDEIDFSSIKSLRYESFKLPIEDLLTIKMALEKLSGLPRQVLELIYYRDLTQEQAARRLGTNQRRVSRILNRGLAEMRKAVSG
jgi:RNA polymerase sigma-B factor